MLQQAGKSEGGFDPRGIYERESPGVVTVIATGLATPGSSNAAGLGSGFVHLRRRRDRHQRPRRHQRRGRRDIRKASNVFVRFADGNQVPAQVKGFDPFADVALLKIDPNGPDAAPAAAGLDEGPARRGAGGRHRQPVRRGAVALGRRHLRAGPLDPVAHRLRHHRRDPDRRGDQPRQLGRPAARRARARARASTPRSRPPRATARASASPSRPTRSGARWPSCAATGARATPTSGWPALPSTRSSPPASSCRCSRAPGSRTSPPTGRPRAPTSRRAATPSASRSAPSAPAATS